MSNRLLLDRDRERYSHIIEELFTYCPETMKRKIPRANVQQAFIFDEVRSLFRSGGTNWSSNTLCVGSFEDTALEALVSSGRHNIQGIDPLTDVDLNTFVKNNTKEYGVIFSTSVLEHVNNDEEFITKICQLLEPGGMAFLTCDFNNEYKPGNPVPATVVRQYTKHDLEVRIKKILNDNDCDYLDVPNWEGEPDFIYQGHKYCFATLVFYRKF